MILLSLVLIVASAATLGWGISTNSQELVWTSLLAGLAAVVLVVASVLRRRRLAVDRVGGVPAPVESASAPAATVAPPIQDHWPWSDIPTGPGASAQLPAGVSPAGVSPAGVAPPGSPRPGWTGAVGPGNADAGVAPAGTASDPLDRADPSAERESGSAGVVPAPDDRPFGEPFPSPAEVTLAAAVPASAPATAEDGEPPVEDVPVRDALRVAQLDDGVVVVDGHPRYHLAGCATLSAAAPVPIAVSAARRGGFTPCGVCGPDQTLLARSRARRAGPATGS